MTIPIWGRPVTAATAEVLRAAAARACACEAEVPEWDICLVWLAEESAFPAPRSKMATTLEGIYVAAENGVFRAYLNRRFEGVTIRGWRGGAVAPIPAKVRLDVALRECEVDLSRVGVISCDEYACVVPLVELA